MSQRVKPRLPSYFPPRFQMLPIGTPPVEDSETLKLRTVGGIVDLSSLRSSLHYKRPATARETASVAKSQRKHVLRNVKVQIS